MREREEVAGGLQGGRGRAEEEELPGGGVCAVQDGGGRGERYDANVVVVGVAVAVAPLHFAAAVAAVFLLSLLMLMPTQLFFLFLLLLNNHLLFAVAVATLLPFAVVDAAVDVTFLVALPFSQSMDFLPYFLLAEK